MLFEQLSKTESRYVYGHSGYYTNAKKNSLLPSKSRGLTNVPNEDLRI